MYYVGQNIKKSCTPVRLLLRSVQKNDFGMVGILRNRASLNGLTDVNFRGNPFRNPFR